MQPRLSNPAMLLPEAMPALQSVWAAMEKGGLPPRLVHLVHLRISQINGCGVCLYGGSLNAKKAGETDERLLTLAGWRDAPFYTEAERAALALAEAVTRLSDREDPVPDEIWNEAARHFEQPQLAALVLAISMVNVWNRLNVATRQVAGAWAG